MAKKFIRKEISWILDRLEETFPDARPELVASNLSEMSAATILSAQCIDVWINTITKEIYKKYKTPQDPVDLGVQDLKPLVRSCGLYRNKAKNIIAIAKILMEDCQFQVPETIEELIKLSGVGQKTASVVASACLGVDATAVDTHVFRTSNRIGLAEAKTVEETEVQLQKTTPKDRWTRTHRLLIFLDRRICASRSPKRGVCPLIEVYHYYHKNQESRK